RFHVMLAHGVGEDDDILAHLHGHEVRAGRHLGVGVAQRGREVGRGVGAEPGGGDRGRVVEHQPVLAGGEVGDVVDGGRRLGSAVDDEGVVAGAAGQDVGALAATDQVVAVAAVDGVVSV